MQGLEKSNDVPKKNFHSRSNRHIDTYCLQLLNINNRRDFYTVKGQMKDIKGEERIVYRRSRRRRHTNRNRKLLMRF